MKYTKFCTVLRVSLLLIAFFIEIIIVPLPFTNKRVFVCVPMSAKILRLYFYTTNENFRICFI